MSDVDRWYRPDHVTQRTDDACALSNCWEAVGEWLAKGATAGAVELQPGRFRALAGGGSGRRNAAGCRAGTEGDVVRGLRRLGLEAGIVEVTRSRARKLLGEVRPQLFGVATAYELWPAAKDCMGGTAGADVNHMVGWDPGTAKPAMNPLCDAYQAVPLADVLAAAFQYAEEQGRPGRIRLVRIWRKIPAGLDGLQKRVRELETELEAAHEALDSIGPLALEIADRADMGDGTIAP